MDVDHGSNKTNNFVDSFAMNIDSSVPVGEILLRNTTGNNVQGTYGFASIGLTVRVLYDDHYYGEHCVNLNECLAFQDCSGNGRCTDSIMTYNCDCNPGYTGQQCQNDIDECLLMVPECSGHGRCVDGINSYTCNCTEGYTGTDCDTDINECLLMEPECSGRGTCTDGDNSFTCNCSKGFTGLMCQINIDDCIGVNCSGHGQCMDGVNNFTCLCQSGFTGVLCSMNTQGINYRVLSFFYLYTTISLCVPCNNPYMKIYACKKTTMIHPAILSPLSIAHAFLNTCTHMY